MSANSPIISGALFQQLNLLRQFAAC